jgi:anti-sigma-K factor RskA
LMRMKGREREEGEEKEEAKTRIKNFTPLSLFLLKNKQTQVPPSTSTPKPTSAPTPPPSNSSFICSATITASSWQSGLLYYAALNIALTSPKVQTPLPYPVSLRIARAVTVDSAWNWSPAKVPTAGWVTGKVSESWQAMGEGKPASLGLIVAGSAADLRPTAVSVSGSFCTVAYA